MKNFLFCSILFLSIYQLHAGNLLPAEKMAQPEKNTTTKRAGDTLHLNLGSKGSHQNKTGLSGSFIKKGGHANVDMMQIEHLVFIDKALPDYEFLRTSIVLNTSKVILIDPESNEGILKMTAEIQKYTGLKSIHIVGHAKQGELILGSDNFWQDDLLMIQQELNAWKDHVAADADLFLYGCSLAETLEGKNMVDTMASLTGMDVIASTNLTGHVSKNGDWNLEYSTGTIEAPIAFSETIKNYPHTLQSLSFSDLRNFNEVDEGTAGDGVWTYPDGTGRTAYQSQNTGQPVYLLSVESGYINEVFKGTITVDSNAGDNDDIGFAFGFNGVNDTYIWSWDMGGISHGGVRSGGSHLLYYKTGSSSFSFLPGNLITKGPNNDPWAHGVTYQFEILYTQDRIKVNVNGITKFDVSAADAGVAQFPPGRFGFYNYSQGGVTFGNIQNAPASDTPIPPSAQNDSYGMEPNTTLSVSFIDGILKNDYDANLDEFTIVLVSDVSNGSLALDTNDGSFTYTPTAGYEGTDTFTYKLVQDDNGAESSVRTVTIGIINSNQAPTDIQLTNASISEGAADNTNIGTLSTTDADNPNDQHDYSLTDNGGGRFTVIGNNLVAANSALLTPGTYTITVRSTDLFGTSFSKNFNITVVSNDKPTSADANVVMGSGANYSFSSTDFSFTDTDGDTFGGIRIETVETAGDLEYEGSDVFNGTVINDISLLNFIAPPGSIGDPYATFTFKVFDSRGGISTDAYTMNIEVADQVNPTAIAQNVVVQLDATGNGSTTAALVDNGSNDAFGIASLSLSQTDFDCSDIANNPNIVTLTVTDTNGNSSTTTTEVTVLDEINPTVIAQNITLQLDATGSASITADQVDNGSTDNCEIDSYSLDITDFTCDDIGENTVVLTVTDVHGNSDTATAIVTVEDTVVPTVITNAMTVQLDATGSASVTANQIDNGSTDNCEIASYSLDVTDFTCDDIGENTVVLTVTDVHGNSATAPATVTVEDTISPTVVTQNRSVELLENGLVTLVAEDFITVDTDNCSITGMTLDRSDFDCADLGDYTVTITVTDASGNATIETAILTITGDDNDGDMKADVCDTDDDNDGTPDTEDAFPLNENEDTDTDGDGTGDNADTDDDGDGTPDTEDAFPLDENEDVDTDGDGTGDNADTDDDGDGTPDAEDAFPLDENEDIDTDGDGTGDNTDTDDDNDGTPDSEDAFPKEAIPDTDNDGIPNAEDAFPNDANESIDTDGDGIGDNLDTDDDGDGYSDEMELAEGTNAKNANEYPQDTDSDGIPDNMDDDDDNDGILDMRDDFPKESTPLLVPAQAFTPNGDGNNDTWVIPGIDNYPNNTVKVFNRWGHEVYAVQGYANDWEGFYKERREKLPQGSYLYVIDLGDGSAPLQGWIFINY